MITNNNFRLIDGTSGTLALAGSQTTSTTRKQAIKDAKVYYGH